jgi:hypothetical protein
MRLRALLACLPVVALTLACGGGGGRDAGGGTGGGAGPPRGEWRWVDVPGTTCSDGSTTGLAVNRGADDARLVIFLDGGGACWDALTCFTFGVAKPGPFREAEWQQRIAAAGPGSILDRTLAGNPYAGATLVFVPYCTGDVHAGDATQRYPGSPRAWRHKGRPNVKADLAWLATALPAPGQVVLSGASAGGYGSLVNYDLVRAQWPDASGNLVDDSGPPLVGDDFSPIIRAAWVASWRLDTTLLDRCPACALDLSRIVPLLAKAYPDDRFALLSSTRDQVIRNFAGGLSGAAFEAAILKLDRDVYAPLPNAETFLVAGDTHAMLDEPASFTADGVPLTEWLRRMVEGEAAWDSAGP